MRIEMLDELGAEFARVAREKQAPRRSNGRVLAIAVTAVVLLSGGLYGVPATRAAIDDLTSTFKAWVGGNDEQAPGRALRPDDDAPNWVREGGGRVIAESNGVQLYATRTPANDKHDTILNFALGDSIAVGDTLEGWRDRFDDHSVIILGPTLPHGTSAMWDGQGRFPLLGVTSRSVERVKLTYDGGPPLVEDGVNGGFVLMPDAHRKLRDIVSYDRAGRELERVDASYIDWSRHCYHLDGCPPGRWVYPPGGP
jgi:hypothetical protein